MSARNKTARILGARDRLHISVRNCDPHTGRAIGLLQAAQIRASEYQCEITEFNSAQCGIRVRYCCTAGRDLFNETSGPDQNHTEGKGEVASKAARFNALVAPLSGEYFWKKQQ